MSTPYEELRALKRETGRNISDLIVLARQRDPFYAGSPTQMAMAGWFASLWEKFGYTTGVHVRAIHYRLIHHTANPTKHDGKPYENTEKCWNYLEDASRYARYLELVDPAALVDRRNPEPRIFMNPAEPEEQGFEYDLPNWYLPQVRLSMSARMPETFVTGYDYEDAMQRHHVEVWAEKSTMNDVLLPVCERHAVNLITGIGQMSVTSVVRLLQRVDELGKPCRILYISDFDPAGDSMPVATARKIEYAISELPDPDIKLDPLVLTAAQVREYDLPRTPIKDSDRSKEKWEQRQGEGAVELDALEALHPGELARVVEQAVVGLRDTGLEERVREARREAEEELQARVSDVLEGHAEELAAIREGVASVVDRHRDTLREVDAELAPYRERTEVVRRAVEDAMEALAVELPPLPEPETSPERGGWLFDSARDYLEQLAAYKAHKNGGAG